MDTTELDLPEPVLAVVEALRFRQASRDRLRFLPADQWPNLMEWCDHRQLTLLVGDVCGDALPDATRERIARCRARAAVRFSRVQAELRCVVEALDRHGIEFVLLKGITHAPALTPDALLRAQGDIDLWFRGEGALRARDVLETHGYASKAGANPHRSHRHLPPMMRRSDWKWRGDMFDVEMPITIELHHDLSFEPADHIHLPTLDSFWDRRIPRKFDGFSGFVLSLPDLLGFAALHLLLHVLHGDLPVQRAWEIARFLHEHAKDTEFWQSWKEFHDPELKQLETVAFRIVAAWFRCTLPDCVQVESAALPDGVRLWLDRCSLSPLRGRQSANKDELWLHLSLLASFGARLHVLARRLFPIRGSRKSQASARLRHHGRTLLPTLREGLRWYRLTRQPAAPEMPRSG